MEQNIYNLFEPFCSNNLTAIDDQIYGNLLLLVGLVLSGVICGALRWTQRYNFRFFNRY